MPDHLHGRAFAAYNGIRNTAELGAFAAGGVLVAAIGARGTLAFAGGLSALAGAVGLADPAPALPRLGPDRPGRTAAPDPRTAPAEPPVPPAGDTEYDLKSPGRPPPSKSITNAKLALGLTVRKIPFPVMQLRTHDRLPPAADLHAFQAKFPPAEHFPVAQA